MATFDISKARSRFPALNQEQIFLDNAGGSQALDTVIESIHQYLSTTNVQIGGIYAASKASTQAFQDAYQVAAKFINASVEEICLGASTTQLFHNLSTALEFQPGDQLILSKLNHEANTAAWVRIAQRLGLTVKWWAAADATNPVCDVEELKTLLSERTRLVACPHVSNITGSITDVKGVAGVVHEFSRALVCVDGVALAPHRPVDVKDLDVDIYAFSWYKVYGPHIAQLYASSRMHDQITSLGHYFNPSETLDQKLNLASANYELAQSIPRVVEHLGPDLPAAWRAIAAYEERLQGTLLGYLNSRPDRFTVIGPSTASREVRVPVVSFVVKGWKSREVVEWVEKKTQSRLGIKSGHMYSHRLLGEVVGLGDDVEDGVVRVSMLHYNTAGEMEEVVGVLESLSSDRIAESVL